VYVCIVIIFVCLMSSICYDEWTFVVIGLNGRHNKYLHCQKYKTNNQQYSTVISGKFFVNTFNEQKFNIH